MAGTPISQYFANVAVKVDEKSLKDVDKYLARIESKLSKGVGGKGLKLNVYIDEGKFNKHLQGVLSRAGKGSPFKLANVTIDPTKLVASVRDVFMRAQFKAPITATISRASLGTIRSQVQAALQGITIGVRTASVSSRGVGGSQGTGSVAASRRASITGRGDPSMQEFLMGKPDKSSLSAGNRRYVDAILGKSFGGVGGNSLSGMAVQGGLGGLARVGSSGVMGRVAGVAGMAMGGPMGAAMGMVGSGVLSLAGSAFTGIWSTLGKVITLPFQAISGAASMVTGAFYRIALAAIPVVAGFNVVNKNVQETKSRQIALNTTAGRFGSNSATESKWLMNMANSEGMAYSSMIDPYTSFMAAAAPTLGLGKTRGIFEAFNQYGSTHGATKESSGRAMYALSQVAAKGTVMSEEINQQMSEAVGYSGMKQLFAEAYQMSLGRTGAGILKGEKAITELTDAMKKGSVKSAKVLPYLEELMRRDSASGLAEARGSSVAQQNRFRNQVSEGWMNFSAGGGEGGIAFFWKIMQDMGQWWISNGAALGRAFETSIYWLDAFRAGVYELSQFISTGEHNSFTNWARSLGVDVDVIRESLLRLRDSVLKLLGIDSTNVSTILDTIVERLIQFIKRLQEIADGATRVVNGVDSVINPVPARMTSTQAAGLAEGIRSDGMSLKSTMMKDFDSRLNGSRLGGLWNIFGGTKDATVSATGALLDLGTGSGGKPVSLPPSIPSWKPDGWGTTASDIGATRRSDYTPQQVNHSVKLEVTGNAEMISALMDEKTRTQLPILLSSEIAKAVVGAPKRD